jgi:hypothetical protein
MIEGKRFLSSFFDKHPTQKKKSLLLGSTTKPTTTTTTLKSSIGLFCML